MKAKKFLIASNDLGSQGIRQSMFSENGIPKITDHFLQILQLELVFYVLS